MTDLINSIQKSIDYDNYLLALLNELKPDDRLTYLPIIQDRIESNTQLINQLNEKRINNTDN